MRDYLKRVFEGGDADGENSATVDSISTHKDYVGAIVFCDPDKLDENVEKINERRPKAAGGASQFFWQYHKIFKRLLEEIAPYEYPLFSKISETRKKN